MQVLVVCLSSHQNYEKLKAVWANFTDGADVPSGCMVEVVDGAGRVTSFREHKSDFYRHRPKGQINCTVLPPLSDQEFMRCVNSYGEDAG
jgi:hypothetical protein